MTREDIDKIFEVDSEGRFVNLIIPALGEFPELDLSGKKRLELSLEEVVCVKKYAAMLFQKTKTVD